MHGNLIDISEFVRGGIIRMLKRNTAAQGGRRCPRRPQRGRHRLKPLTSLRGRRPDGLGAGAARPESAQPSPPPPPPGSPQTPRHATAAAAAAPPSRRCRSDGPCSYPSEPRTPDGQIRPHPSPQRSSDAPLAPSPWPPPPPPPPRALRVPHALSVPRHAPHARSPAPTSRLV